MKEVDYDQIWNQLKTEAEGKQQKVLVKRLVFSSEWTELHLAVDSEGLKRYLLVRMPDNWDKDTSSMPKWTGAIIGSMTGAERPIEHRFLVIEQGAGSSTEVFEALTSDICNSVSQPEVRDILSVLISRLERWKYFFEEHGLGGLSPESQQGLFGELYFLRDYLIPALGLSQAILSWNITRRANHDFQVGDHAIEIKTSSAKQHLKFHVASERQLDTKGLGSLHVAVINLTVIQGGGETLPQMVADVRSKLSEYPSTLRIFEDKLIDEGYLDIHGRDYRNGYTVTALKTYEIREGFPRILPEDLKEGVGDVTYSVVLSSCQDFRVDTEKALNFLSNFNSQRKEHES
ncbi:MAG: PD-(D/E)XK motif protein [Thermoplasmatales archaeon]|nr:PD-(D/E)XK motif protein [Thermoplasmatales archaeon]